jgi:hypothetical protein
MFGVNEIVDLKKNLTGGRIRNNGYKRNNDIRTAVHKFSKNLKATSKFRNPKYDTKQVPY